jgi:hypothetical protein
MNRKSKTKKAKETPSTSKAAINPPPLFESAPPIITSDSILILNNDTLDHIFSFLNFTTIKKLRLVCKPWAAAGLFHLNRRGHVIIHWDWTDWDRLNPEKRSRSHWIADLRGATTLQLSSFSNLNFHIQHALHSKQLNHPAIWANVRTLHISLQLTNRKPILWIHKLISSLASDKLTTLSLNFDERLPVSGELESDYDLAIDEQPNLSFPTPIPQYPHLTSLTFHGIDRPTTAYFATELLSSCVNLSSLEFKTASHSYRSRTYDFALLEELREVKDSLKKLESFTLTIQRVVQLPNPNTGLQQIYTPTDAEFVAFVRNINKFGLAFSKKLKSLVWDVPFARKVNSATTYYELLPGILTESVTSSLVKLQLNTAVFDMAAPPAERDTPPTRIPISFPTFHNLRQLTLSSQTAATLSLSDFLDAAPSLHSLVIIGPSPAIIKGTKTTGVVRSLWAITDGAQQQKHTQLRKFTAEFPFPELSTLEHVFNKCPNLEQLTLGDFSSMQEPTEGLATFITLVSSKLPKLKRLTLAWELYGLSLHQLLAHIAQLPALLPNLHEYVLKRDESLFDPKLYEYTRSRNSDKLESPGADLTELLSTTLSPLIHQNKYPSTGGEGRVFFRPSINLHVDELICRRKNPEDEHSFCSKNCWSDQIQNFIKAHSLPIKLVASSIELGGTCPGLPPDSSCPAKAFATASGYDPNSPCLSKFFQTKETSSGYDPTDNDNESIRVNYSDSDSSS